jgi:hypothetical protein
VSEKRGRRWRMSSERSSVGRPTVAENGRKGGISSRGSEKGQITSKRYWESFKLVSLRLVDNCLYVAKDSELQQATFELEGQLRAAATSLSEFKLRAANAETQLGDLCNTATRSASLEKEIRDRNQLIAKLRHDGAYLD